MDLAVSREEMEAAFGAGHLVTVPLERQNPVVTHEPSRVFLAEIGLPGTPDELFVVDDELAAGMRLCERWAPLEGEVPDTWVIVGWFWDDILLLDGVTGAIHVLHDGSGTIRYLNAGLDRLARFLIGLSRDIARFDPAVDDELRVAATTTLMAEFRAADPTAFAEPEGYWEETVASELSYGY